MRLRDALRLKRGDLIAWGHSQWTREIERVGSRETGSVITVTPRGGVRVCPDGADQPKWIPYNWIIRKLTEHAVGGLRRAESFCFG
jgi:hypothetical protein